jgi:iron(III) transport system permease protein
MSTAVGLSLIMIVFVAVAWIAQDRILRSGRHTTVGSKGQRFQTIRLKGWRPVARAVMLLYGVLAVVLPLGGLILVTLNGFWTPNINWAGLSLRWLDQTVLQRPLAMHAIGNSVLLGVVGATIGVMLAAIISVFIARTRTRWTRVLDGGIKLPSVVSHLVIGVGMILAFAGPPFGWGATILILLVAYVTIYLPQASVSTDAAVTQVGKELVEASSVAGAGYGKTFARIYLPLILPAMVAGWAYLFARMAGDLEATAILSGPSNITVGFLLLQTYQNGSYGQLAPFAVILTLISAAVVITVISLANRSTRRRNRLGTARAKNTEGILHG